MIKNISIIFIILLFPIFLLKEYWILKSKKDLQICASSHRFTANEACLENKCFTFIVLTQNDAETVEKNYESILSQDYKQWNVIYIDQGSSDGTVALLKKKIIGNPNVKLIQCQQPHEAYRTYYQEVLKRADHDIIVHLYGSDWLAHQGVLSTLSQLYSHPKVWLSYGQYLEYGESEKEWSLTSSKNMLYKRKMRKIPWILAPVKTYYAGLLKKNYSKGFFPSIENENALLSSVAKLSGLQIRFIPDILFIHYNKKESYQRCNKKESYQRVLKKKASSRAVEE